MMIGCSSTIIYKNDADRFNDLAAMRENTSNEIGKTSRNQKYTEVPIIERQIPPKYPEEALTNKWEGKILLNVEILDTGKVGMVEILETTGYTVLDEAAVNAAKKWRFSPALNETKPVSVWVEFPLEFEIK